MFTDDFIANNESELVTYVSLGNYCKTSYLLKSNNLKYESYPFDWMITSIEIINKVISNNFKEFLNKKNYSLIKNKSTKNSIYFDDIKNIFPDAIDNHSHHNLLDEGHYQYICRCVDRFNNLGKYETIKFIMIQPLYLNNLKCNYESITNLYNILIKKFGEEKVKLIIFNINSKKNSTFKEEKINNNLSIFELDTNIVKGPRGMEYFDKKGIKKFIEIITEF